MRLDSLIFFRYNGGIGKILGICMNKNSLPSEYVMKYLGIEPQVSVRDHDIEQVLNHLIMLQKFIQRASGMTSVDDAEELVDIVSDIDWHSTVIENSIDIINDFLQMESDISQIVHRLTAIMKDDIAEEILQQYLVHKLKGEQ